MMNMINLDKLEGNIKTLNGLYNDFFGLCNDFFMVINNISSCWNNKYINLVFESIKADKNKYMIFLDEYKRIIDFLSMIEGKYVKLGSKIEFDISESDKLIKKINDYSDNIDYLINMYKDIDIVDINEKCLLYLEKEKNEYEMEKKVLLSKKNKIKKMIVNISSNESDIKKSISKFVINEIKNELITFDFKCNYLMEDTDMERQSIELEFNKLNYYVKEEYINLDSLSTIFKDICVNYNTENQAYFKDIFDSFLRKYNFLIKKQSSYIFFLKKKYSEYIDYLRS